MHEAPERNWRVEELAAVAGMSRSVFSNLFHDTVGEPPASYLQRWRLGLVQKWLKQGLPLRLIAEEAGYGSESSLSRAFKSQCGLSPRDWLKSENARADTAAAIRRTPYRERPLQRRRCLRHNARPLLETK